MNRQKRTRLFAFSLIALTAVLAAPAGATSPSDDQGGVNEASLGVSFGHAVPISVPPYYGIEPKLSVAYNVNGSVGLAGPGWNLAGFSLIERQSRSLGLPQYDATDRIFLDGQELLTCSSATTTSVSCAAGGTHTTKLESFAKVVRSGDTFSVCKDGICTTYAPIICTAEGVYRWGVASVKDHLGRTVLYTWNTNNSCSGSAGPGTGTPSYAFPQRVSYNGGKFVIDLFYENSVQQFPLATGNGDIVLNKRLKTIDVKVLNARHSAHSLSYQAATDVLSSIQPYGTDAVLSTAGVVTGGSTALPAQTFVAAAPTVAFGAGAQASTVTCPQDAVFTSADVNGDGFGDFVCIDARTGAGDSNNRILVYVNNKQGGFAAPTQLPYPDAKKPPTLVDINCDRRPDLVWVSTTCPQQWKARLNNGAGVFATTDVSVANLPTDVDLFASTQFTDVNADGCTDIVYPSTQSGPAYRTYKVMYGQQVESNMCVGEEQFLMNHPADAPPENVTTPNPLRLIDVNGNGAADAVYVKAGTTVSTAEARALLGGGYALDQASVSLGLLSEFQSLALVNFAQLAAGRGSDMVYLRAGTPSIMVRPWNNATRGFGTAVSVASAPTGIPIVSLSNGDFNGDGQQDIVAIAPNGAGLVSPWLYLNRSTEPRVTEIRNGAGLSRRLTYANAATMPNTFDVPAQMVVRSIVDSAAAGTESTTTFDYDKGVYDPLEKRFLGFWKVGRTQSCVGTVCPRTTVYFDIDYTGPRPSRVDRGDTSNKLWESTVLRYAPKNTLPYSNPLTEKWVYRYDAASTAARRQTYGYRYDRYGRPAATIEYGEGTTALRMTVNEYTALDNAKFLSQLARTARYEGDVVLDAKKLSETTYTYDANGLMATSSVWVSPAPAGTTNPYVTTTYAYDSLYRVAQVTAPMNRVTKFTYETALGMQVATTTNPLGQVESKIWHSTCRTPSSTTGLNGDVTAFTYDPFCRETSKTHSSGSFERTSYFPGAPRRVRVEKPGADASGNFWVDTYLDGYDRPIEVRTKGLRTTIVRKSYDAHGNLASESQPFFEGTTVYSTNYAYDVLGRNTRTLYASGEVVTTAHGVRSTCVTDEEGHVDCDDLDTLGNRSVHRESSGGRWISTTFLYTPRGEVRQIRDALGNLTTYTLDSLGRKVIEVDPAAGTTRTVYNAAGEVVSQTNGLNETAVSTYDALGRLRVKTTRNGTADAETVGYEYDRVETGNANIGRLTRMTDGLGNTAFSYDSGGNLVRKVRTFVSDGDTPPAPQTFLYTYDLGNRVTSATSPDGTITRTTYDAAALPAELRLGTSLVASVDYDAAGKPVHVDFGNSATSDYTFEPTRHFLTRLQTTAKAPTFLIPLSGPTGMPPLRMLTSPLASMSHTFVYTRDGEGRVTGIARTFGATTEQLLYGYDQRHQLLSATSTLNGTQLWTYDDIGRTLTSPLGVHCYQAASTAYPAPHLLRAVGACATQTYSFNAIGALVTGPLTPNDPTDGMRTMTYDGDGRLEKVSMTLEGVANPYVETYAYDARGARLRSTTSSTPGVVASRTYYVGDDYEIARQGTTETVTQYYSLGGLRVAKRKRQGTVDQVAYQHLDHLGSVVGESNASGAWATAMYYEAYGVERPGKVGAGALRHRGYLGEMQDPTGLLYLNARYYDPAVARFVSVDPVRSVDTTLGLHPYAYSLNDPINRSDPSGETSTKQGGDDGSAKSDADKEGGGVRKVLGTIVDKVGQVLDAIDRRFTIIYPDPGDPEGYIQINLLDNFARGGLTIGKYTGKRIFVAGQTGVVENTVEEIQKIEKEAKVLHWYSNGRLVDDVEPSQGLGIVEFGFASVDDMGRMGAGGWGAIYPTIVHNSDQVIYDLRGMRYQPIKTNGQWWVNKTDSEVQFLYTTLGQQALGKVFFKNIPTNFPVPMITPSKWRTTYGP